MKRIHVRILLAFIFLALVQIACGCSINHDVNAHAYQDLNGNSKQDSGEPDFPGIEIDSTKDINYNKTDANGNVNVGKKKSKHCEDYWPTMRVPSGYTITENDRSPASWDFSPPLANLGYGCTGIFANDQQTRSWSLGLQPTFKMTKTASPTTFSAPGETITYTYMISNTTANGFSQVSVTDDKTTVTCPATTVAVGETMTYTSTYTTTAADVSAGSIINTAQFTATAALKDYFSQVPPPKVVA